MPVLGAVFAVLSAATFALTNAMGRRGVITGTPVQGMVISIPVALLCFLAVAFLTGVLDGLNRISAPALAALSAAGVLHCVVGRHCNFRVSQAAGVNVTAPVMQLNAVVTLVLAVVVLREPCTLLQIAGGVLMVTGSLVTQRASPPIAENKMHNRPVFTPRVAVGFFFASLAAPMYGTSPIIVRLSLVFRFLFALLLNPQHELSSAIVVIGSLVSIAGACAVSINTEPILAALAVPPEFAAILRTRF